MMLDPVVVEQLARVRATRTKALRAQDLSYRERRRILDDLSDLEIAVVATLLRPVFEDLAERFCVDSKETAAGIERLLLDVALHGTVPHLEQAIAIMRCRARPQFVEGN